MRVVIIKDGSRFEIGSHLALPKLLALELVRDGYAVYEKDYVPMNKAILKPDHKKG